MIPLGFLILPVLLIGLIPTIQSETFEEQVNSNYSSTLWSVGNNLQEGDLYIYKICDNSLPRTVIDSHCYTIELQFLQILESWRGPVWIVQGILNYDDANNQPITKHMIFQINPKTLEVYPDRLNFELANSLEHTIFSLSAYSEKSLTVGTLWDDIDSYFTNSIPLEIKRQQNIITPFGDLEVFVLGYDVIEESNFFIDDFFAFPIRGDVYSPHLIFPEPQQLFYYELISYSNNYYADFYGDNSYDNIINGTFYPTNELGVVSQEDNDFVIDEESLFDKSHLDELYLDDVSSFETTTSEESLDSEESHTEE